MIRSIKARLLSLGSVLLLSFCAGCTPGDNLGSVKAENYNKTPKSILVLYPPGGAASRIGSGFDQVFQKFADNCNIAFHSDYDAQKVKTTDIGDALIPSAKPDWVLRIAPIETQQSTPTLNGIPVGGPHLSGIIYNFTLIDQPEKKKVWRTNVGISSQPGFFSSDDFFGKDTATAAIHAMQKDGLLALCPAP